MKKKIIDLLEAIFMPATHFERQRLDPTTDRLVERMRAFDATAPRSPGTDAAPPPADRRDDAAAPQRGAACLYVLVTVLVVYASMLTAGSCAGPAGAARVAVRETASAVASRVALGRHEAYRRRIGA